MHRMIVKASRGILPRILHVDSDVIETFDLDSGYAKIEVGSGDLHHIRRRSRRRLGFRDGYDLLRYHFPLMRESRKRSRAQILHLPPTLLTPAPTAAPTPPKSP